MVHGVVKGLNDNHRLPRYILMIPDKDILTCLHKKNINAALVMGSTIHYLIKQIDMFLERRRQDLADKKKGALLLSDTKVVWVRMLKRPAITHNKDFTETSSPSLAAYALRGKFNSILEERLFDGKDNCHRIMSIDVQASEFDRSGSLTSAGKEEFWEEVNRGMKKLDKGKISLLPRKPVQGSKNTGKKLPKPPVHINIK